MFQYIKKKSLMVLGLVIAMTPELVHVDLYTTGRNYDLTIPERLIHSGEARYADDPNL